MDSVQAEAIERVQQMKDRRVMARAIMYLICEQSRNPRERLPGDGERILTELAAIVERN